ncbi:PREDICTED: dual specificity protein phosphatase 12 isoform X2 [Gekko japonicus]|uniref:protein-tyrosine-phosphatase n=1 Tax=Gekko japonicus TaxID=146911 RepID=A0ABM1K3V2_GEKJA|nr:PREDICTED: dual specificity protein phosphatase 12 isoform X2 [Gekko japonicus]
MVPVLPGLYLGCGLADAEEAGRGVVTALLLVDSEPPAAAEGELEAVLRVPLLDEPLSDLLSHLDACAAFISRARKGGGAVLVRCHAGVSRSVAVVTAYLMKANNLPFEEAYAFVRSLRPEAKMNEGFEWQLKLYERMGCEVDVTSPLYKQYRLQKVTEKYPELRDLPRDIFAADPSVARQTPSYEALYKCRKCRRLLFQSSSVLSHTEGKGPAAFAHKRLPDHASFQRAGPSACTSYFVEPVQWMEPALLGVLEGQLLCPKCSSKLGSFHWHGEQCSCGHWVTPAFQIHKSRVDEVKGLLAGSLQTGR